MRAIEIRRHSLRDKPGEHLSAAGRRLAEEVGRGRGPFRLSVSSPAARAIETAEAMGWPPGVRSELWFDLGGGEIPWPLSFSEARDQLHGRTAARTLGGRLRAELDRIRTGLREGQEALVVTHGGFPELCGALYATPEKTEELGGPCRCLEGVWLAFDPSGVVQCRGLRLPADRTRL